MRLLCIIVLLSCFVVFSGYVSSEENELLRQFPEERLKIRNESLTAFGIGPSTRVSLGSGQSQEFIVDLRSLKLPKQGKGQVETFLSTHFEMRSSETQLEWLTVRQGKNEAQAAPLIGGLEWQSGVVVFPFEVDLNKPLSFEIKASAPLDIRRLRGLYSFDRRYLRAPCSKREFVRSGRILNSYDYHEQIEYRADSEKKRVVFIGNSTIDGCGDRIHGTTLSMMLQQALHSRFTYQYEVLNGGIGAASLIGHIISIVSYAPVRQREVPEVEDLLQSKNERAAWSDLQPDLIFLAAHWNDIEDFSEYLNIGRDVNGRFFVHNYLSALFDYVRGRGSVNHSDLRLMSDELQRLKIESVKSPYVLTDRDYAEHFEFLNDKFLEFQDEFLPHAEIVLLTLPNISTYSNGIDERLQSQVLKKIAKERGIKFIDTATRFNAIIKEDELLATYALNYMFTDSIHMTHQGRQWVITELQKQMDFEAKK